MRAISADASAVLTGLARRASVRLSVKDSGGTYRDLTTYALGENLFKSITWREDIDSAGLTWEASLVREQEVLSLAPMVKGSGLNRQFNIATAYAPLLQVGRAMKVEYALQAEDDPTAPTWVLAFTGYIDTVSWGTQDEVTITGRGEEAVLLDCYVERERVYAYGQGANATKGLYIFEPLQTYAVNDLVMPTSANVNAHFYKVTAITTGIADTIEPAWPTGAASTVVSAGVTFTETGAGSGSVGTAVETIIQQILNDNGFSAVVLSTPVSPAWAVKWFLVARQLLFGELKTLADQIGWFLRYKFDSGTGTMKFTLYDPGRGATTSLRTFPIGEVSEIRRAEVEIFDIRNVVQVVYSDSQALDPGGHPKRKRVAFADTTSIAKYGRRFCELAEGSTSNIDTTTEANNLANIVLSDLKEPNVDVEASVSLFPYIELPDLYTIASNGVHFDTDQLLAVVGYDHVHSADDSQTTLRLRGAPSSGKSTWLQRTTDAYNGAAAQLTAATNAAPVTLTADTKSVGGARITFTWQQRKP